MSFIEALHPSALDRADVHENILAAIIGLDEAEAFLDIEPLHGSFAAYDFPSGAVATRPRASAARPLFTSKLALTRDSLVRFGYALDPILELAVPLRQPPSYHVAATGCASIWEACNERHFLTGSKLVLCHHMAFRAHARGPDTARRSLQQAEGH